MVPVLMQPSHRTAVTKSVMLAIGLLSSHSVTVIVNSFVSMAKSVLPHAVPTFAQRLPKKDWAAMNHVSQKARITAFALISMNIMCLLRMFANIRPKA
jgi:hypothetical protein